jgi:hypothetical protein
MRLKVFAFFTAFALFASPSFAGYDVVVNGASGWRGNVGKMAIAPAVCPPEVDCIWLNETIADEVEGYSDSLSTVDSTIVSQALFEAGADQLTAENSVLLAEELGVQSFLIVVVGHSGDEQVGALGFPIGSGMFAMGAAKRSQASVEVRIVSADGKLMAKGYGYGDSGFRKKKGVLGKTFAEILAELFPEG